MSPGGLAFDAARDRFILLDAADPGLPGGARAWTMTRRGEPAGALRLEAGAGELSGIAYDGASGDLLLVEGDHLVQLPGRRDASQEADGLDRVSLGALGLRQPRGVAFDPVSGSLFALDGEGPSILRVDPDGAPGLEGLAGGRASRIDLGGAGLADVRGLAFNPEDSRLYVLSPSARRLHEITLSGEVAASHDLSSLRVRHPEGLAVAPSGDPTDDPRRQSLYILDSGGPSGAAGEEPRERPGHIVEIYRLDDAQMAAALTTQALVESFQSALVRTTNTWQWSPPSPDPSGIAYLSAFGRLLVCDGEVEETIRWAGANVWETTLTGSVSDTSSTTAFSSEPVGAAFNPGNWHLFLSDDDSRRIYEIDPRGDGLYGTGDDVVTSFSTIAFGSDDPEGLAFDSLNGYLYVADGVGREVYEIRPGPNGRFNGVPPAGDDQVSSFDVLAMGLLDPEGIDHNPDLDRLYIVDRSSDTVAEMTTAGILTRTIDISAAGASTPAGGAYAPSSFDAAERSLYVVDRGADNDSDPNENDGKMYEMTLPAPPPPPNQAVLDVRVAAGADDAEERGSGSMSLTSGDLDMMLDGSTLLARVGLRFAGVTIPRGARIVSAYVQFRSDEATADFTSLTIRGQDADNALSFTTTSRNISSRPLTAASVSWVPQGWTGVGLAGPLQRTSNLSGIIQQIVGRGGWISGNSLALIISGSGRRVADSFEGGATAAPLLHVQYEIPSGNQAPVANAGPDQTVTLVSGAVLAGSFSDDGRPNPPATVTVTWSQTSGPGTATFSNRFVVNPSVTFSAEGSYVLRLTASDSALSHSDDMTITVVGPGTVFTLDVRVASGLDDAEDELDGDMDMDSGDLDITLDGSSQQRSAAMRFNGVAIPHGSTIVSAYVQFKADEATADPTTLTIRGEYSDNAAPFAAVRGNISSRLTTSASATWAPDPWTIVGEMGPLQRTSNLAVVIEQVVGRQGWIGGNSMVIIITGSGRRVAESYEGSATGAALLHVEYRTGS